MSKPVKLIRDQLAQDGRMKKVEYIQVSKSEHINMLRNKLLEEVGEYLEEPSVEELADIVAVARSLAKIDLEIEWEDLLAIEESKADERGRFEEGYVLAVTD